MLYDFCRFFWQISAKNDLWGTRAQCACVADPSIFVQFFEKSIFDPKVLKLFCHHFPAGFDSLIDILESDLPKYTRKMCYTSDLFQRHFKALKGILGNITLH